MVVMVSMQRRVREPIIVTKGWEEPMVVLSITLTVENIKLAPGWWAEEGPLKPEKHSSEPLLEEEETGCHQKKSGRMCMMIGICLKWGTGTEKRVGDLPDIRVTGFNLKAATAGEMY